MFRQSIKRKIVSIAIGLIVLMVIASVLSMLMAGKVGHLLDGLTTKYIPAYGDLARTNIRSLERALALRRMVIAKMQTPPDQVGYAASSKVFEEKGLQVEQEAEAARKLINALIEDVSTPSDRAELARLEDRIDTAINDSRRHLNKEIAQLLPQLEAKDFAEARRTLAQVDEFRDEFNEKINSIRADMLAQVYSSASAVMRDQSRAVIISAILTGLAAVLGLVFAILVSGGITRPVRLLLEGTRAVEAGRLNETLQVTSKDEIGHLTRAFNRMIEQLRLKERIRETFGKYVDPRVVEGLIDQPVLAAGGERRVMTVLFCDLRGFTGISEGMTPQGLVKVTNRYLSMMSEPIRTYQGVIDKYIGDAVMAYWGPPFNEDADQARLACLAALDMVARVVPLQAELPELLGVRSVPPVDIRIGVATGEALVGSIGSEFMMSYTVMGDTVNLASRLEGANKLYGTRLLTSEATAKAAASDIEVREIDRVVVVGQSEPQAVFEIMARKGELTAQQSSLQVRFAEALVAYRARQWDEARRGFEAALKVVPDDGPSMAMLTRLNSLESMHLADTWDGAWHLDEK